LEQSRVNTTIYNFSNNTITTSNLDSSDDIRYRIIEGLKHNFEYPEDSSFTDYLKSVDEDNSFKDWYICITELLNQDFRELLRPEKDPLFVCYGVIDKIIDCRVYATLFQNEQLDFPQLIEFERDDFPENELREQTWFLYKQFRKQNGTTVEISSIIEIIPYEPYTEDEAIDDYNILLNELPDEC